MEASTLPTLMARAAAGARPAATTTCSPFFRSDAKSPAARPTCVASGQYLHLKGPGRTLGKATKTVQYSIVFSKVINNVLIIIVFISIRLQPPVMPTSTSLAVNECQLHKATANHSHCPISTETHKQEIPATVSPGQARTVDRLLMQNHKMLPSSRANKKLGFRFKSQRVPVAQEHIRAHSQQGLSSTLGILSCCKSQVLACLSGCGDLSQSAWTGENA